MQFYDLNGDQTTKKVFMLIMVIFMMLLTILRYFRTKAMLEGTQKIPEKGLGSGLVGSGLVWWLTAELVVISLHSGPFVPFKTVIFKSTIEFGDMYD